ncbi:hypothetical protein [Actinophytocola gossypii]|uniref:HEAT repeat domain-containing protein n=1 Tax=Actinophytocola gossypii TaxID=2812003 RepID=A0ABT2JA60_9PSEU|nr:hypothetical protein [Actinophytocola gossypii]MCT2584169.1 hypothetical protein [Actinophytocola gossypii]
MITARRLLAGIDGLPYAARQQELASHARALAGTAELAALLDDLHGRGGFGPRVALHLAQVAGDTGYVARCLTAEQGAVVARALVLAVRLELPPATLVEALPGLSTALRRTLYREVGRRRASAVADALLPAVLARFGDVEAAVLLPVCGAATVAARLPDLEHAVTGWGRLAQRNPTLFLDWLDDELDRADPAHLVPRVARGIVASARVEPARVLALLTGVAPRTRLPSTLRDALTPLARHDPAGVLAVLLDPRRRGEVPDGRKLWRAVLALPDEDLVRFGRALEPHRFARFLRVFPPARRPAVYAGVLGDRDLPDSTVPLDALDLLPSAARHAEAERLLGRREVADDRHLRLAVTARLSWPAARETLRAETRRPTADERGTGYRLLVAAAAATRDPETVGAVLGSLDRLANEQDPVRLEAFGALAAVPPWLFRPDQAPDLLRLVTDALAARDCSWQTRGRVRTLIDRLIRHGALTRQVELVEAGLTALGRFGEAHQWLNLTKLDHELPRGAEHLVLAALRPRLTEDARHGRFRIALSLAGGLGRRAWHLPELQELVGRARKATDDVTVRRAIALWLDPPATRDERLAEVFHDDRSTISLDPVRNGIGLRRTDLVDEALAKPLHGRFIKRGIRYVPYFAGCFGRWLPRQCATYADRLAAVADRRGVQVWERVPAVARLGQVPGTADRLRGYLADAEVPVVEAALGALAWTDVPAEALADLLAHADTDRARVAVYAAARCARFVPPDRLRTTLAAALDSRKVTSRKEAVRLLAAHHAPDVAGLLTDVWRRPDEHRDVRRAVVWATRWCLDDERAWTVLAEASRAAPDVATSVLDVDPYAIATRHRPRYATLVHAVADSPDADTARLGLAALAAWARWDDDGAGLLIGRVTDLTGTAAWRPALTALVAGCVAVEDPAPLVTAATALLATPEPPVTPDRDLPVRQRLLAVANAVQDGAATSAVLRAAAASLADVLAGDPTLRRPAVELAVAAVGLDRTAEDEARLSRVAELADETVWAWHAHHALHARVRRRADRLPPSYLHGLAAALAGDEHAPAAQLLALALAEADGSMRGWTPEWRELVTGLREHGHPDVRVAARDVVTARE